MGAIVITERERTWFEEGFEHALWHHSCSPYDAEIRYIEDIEQENSWRKLIPEGYTVVALVESGDILLEDFKHPENAVYFFGRSQRGDDFLPGLLRVRIDTPKDICFFGHVAAAIMLNDRFQKGG